MYYYHIKQGTLVSDKVPKEINNFLSTKIVLNNVIAKVINARWHGEISVWAGLAGVCNPMLM